MTKEDVAVIDGKVLECLPGTLFKVQVQSGKVLLCHLCGKIRQNFIKIIPGDRVRLEVSKYDFSKGRIVYREKKETNVRFGN